MKLNPIGSNMNELTITKVKEANGIPYTETISILFSYQTPVAGCDDESYFRTDQKWGVTTSRHINKYVRSDCRTVPQAWIDSLID